MTLNKEILLGTAIVLCALTAPVEPARAQNADTILFNGKVLTVDKNFSIAQAVAIKDGKFLAVGSNTDVHKTSGPATRMIDLRGQTVIPGLIDGHAHMDREGLKTIYPSLGGARSIDDILKIIEREVGKAKAGEWVVTMPIGDPPYYLDVPGNLKENRLPTRQDLDKVSPNNPVYIRGIWGWWNRPPVVSIANSAALKLAKITRDTPAPYDKVTIQKDQATGEPTGVFMEESFEPIVDLSLMAVAPRFTHAQRVAALKESLRVYHSQGITGVYEGHSVSFEVIHAFKELWNKHELTVRSYLVFSPTPGKTLPEFEETLRDWGTYLDGPGFGDDMLRIGGTFVPVLGNPNAARIRKDAVPYVDWASYYVDKLTPEAFRDRIFLQAKYGVRVNVIAPFQRSLDQVLGIFEEVNQTYPIVDKRWVIFHHEEATQKNVQQMKALGVILAVIPTKYIWMYGADPERQPNDRRGANPQTTDRFQPYNSLMKAGIPVAIGTDNSPANGLFAIWSAIARKNRDTGRVMNAAEKLSRQDALRAMTMNGAYLSFEEKVRGSIETGKSADLAVLTRDYMTVPEDDIKDIRVGMTMVGGNVVYQRQ